MGVDAGHAEHRGAVPADRGDGRLDLGAFVVGELVEIAGDPRDQPPDPGDLLLRWHGFGFGPLVDIGGGGSEDSFAAAQQVIEIGLQVGQVGDGAEVVAAGAAESVGQAFPPALTLEGSAQTPKGTATWPTLRRACSESSSAWAWRQMRLPCRSNCIVVTRSTASRRRCWPTL